MLGSLFKFTPVFMVSSTVAFVVRLGLLKLLSNTERLFAFHTIWYGMPVFPASCRSALIGKVNAGGVHIRCMISSCGFWRLPLTGGRGVLVPDWLVGISVVISGRSCVGISGWLCRARCVVNSVHTQLCCCTMHFFNFSVCTMEIYSFLIIL